jgi:hypothetical protein
MELDKSASEEDLPPSQQASLVVKTTSTLSPVARIAKDILEVKKSSDPCKSYTALTSSASNNV